MQIVGKEARKFPTSTLSCHVFSYQRSGRHARPVPPQPFQSAAARWWRYGVCIWHHSSCYCDAYSTKAQHGGLPCFETHKEQTKKEKICASEAGKLTASGWRVPERTRKELTC